MHLTVRQTSMRQEELCITSVMMSGFELVPEALTGGINYIDSEIFSKTKPLPVTFSDFNFFAYMEKKKLWNFELFACFKVKGFCWVKILSLVGKSESAVAFLWV